MPGVPVFLNHFFLTLDSKTFAEVKAMDWLRTAFAPYEERTTKRNDTSYSGIYFYGRNTYFEFFEVGSEGKAKAAGGIAFGVEAAGAARALAPALPDQTLITRQVGNVEAPWFHSASPAGAQRGDFFRAWVMEYHSDFLKTWHPELAPAESPNPLRRRNVLDRYVAHVGEANHRNDFLLKDVVAINVSLPHEAAASLQELLAAFDYQFMGGTATGPEIRITITKAKPLGIRSVVFSLQRSVPGDFSLDLGASRLMLGTRGQAVWEFDRVV